MFVCEIPDKALIITEEQGHIDELLICSFFFSYESYEYCKLNSGKRGMVAGLWQRQFNGDLAQNVLQ